MFYNFRQNNSGGVFEFDEKSGISASVIIEAPNPDVANVKAEFKGLYFDGCDKGIDCSCCGDRWYPLYEKEEGDEVPSVYGIPVENLKKGFDFKNGEISKWMKDGVPDVFVHYEDGRIEGFFKN